jgi:response regulator RpfG family c-di-GMP phosphodiesterase
MSNLKEALDLMEEVKTSLHTSTMEQLSASAEALKMMIALSLALCDLDNKEERDMVEGMTQLLESVAEEMGKRKRISDLSQGIFSKGV